MRGDGSFAADHVQLRRRAADYIRLHASAFAPFLPYEPADLLPLPGSSSRAAAHAGGGTGDAAAAADAASADAVERYCARLETSSAAWGGHPEIRALSCTLGVPIEIFQADGAPWKMAPDAHDEYEVGRATARGEEDAVLRLSYHRHYYALGEHYNAVIPMAATAAPMK